MGTQNRQPRGWKKREQTWTWISSKRKKGEVCDTFLTFYELSRVCIQVKFPQSHQERWLILSRWPTQPLSPQVLAVAFLLLTIDCPVLSVTFLPFSSSGLVGDLACKPFVWVSRQNRQRDPLTGTHRHPHNECPTSCHNKYIYIMCFIYKWRRCLWSTIYCHRKWRWLLAYKLIEMIHHLISLEKVQL